MTPDERRYHTALLFEKEDNAKFIAAFLNAAPALLAVAQAAKELRGHRSLTGEWVALPWVSIHVDAYERLEAAVAALDAALGEGT